MPDYAEVGPEFFASARHRMVLHQDVPASPMALFRCLEDPDAWNRWLGLDDVTWTSPLGPGATRTIRNGPLTIDEEFFAWEPGVVMSFRFSRAAVPLRAFAEEYRILEAGDGTSQLQWTAAADGPWPIARAFVKGLERLGRKSLPRLAALMREDGARYEEG